MLLPEGKTPAYLGQAVAMLIFHDFARFRFAKEKLQFNDKPSSATARVTGPLQRDPWGAGRFVRVGGKTGYDEDVFSSTKQAPVSPSTYDKHQPVWPSRRSTAIRARRACITPRPSTRNWRGRRPTGWC